LPRPTIPVENCSEKTLEARILPQRIKNRIDFDFKGEPVAFFNGLCKPDQGSLLVAQFAVTLSANVTA